MIKLTASNMVQCPKCGAYEVANPDAPMAEWRLNIRACKVVDARGSWSQCLVCAANGDAKKGWFCD